jgi:hypothetical protein
MTDYIQRKLIPELAAILGETDETTETGRAEKPTTDTGAPHRIDNILPTIVRGHAVDTHYSLGSTVRNRL